MKTYSITFTFSYPENPGDEPSTVKWEGQASNAHAALELALVYGRQWIPASADAVSFTIMENK